MLNVAVFFGGKSSEHEISCISANQALHAINSEKYNVIPVYISKTSEFYTGDRLFDLANYANLDELTSKLTKVGFVKDGTSVYMKPVKGGLFSKSTTVDVAFLVTHGINAEDGSLAGYLEMLDIPYTSSNVLASAIAQDKCIQKIIFEKAGIPTIEYFICYQHDFEEKEIKYLAKAKALSFPVILKPANLGSSIGIEIAHNEKEFAAKMRDAFKYDAKILVERCLKDFFEVNCSVIGVEHSPKASILEEVAKKDEILSFKDKYIGNGKGGSKGTKGGSKSTASKGMASATRIIPARISEEQTNLIKNYSIKAFNAIDASGVVRIDYMIDPEGHIYLEEINNIPGSLAFYLWEKEDINFEKLTDILIENAIKKYGNKEKRISSFDTNILAGYKK